MTRQALTNEFQHSSKRRARLWMGCFVCLLALGCNNSETVSTNSQDSGSSEAASRRSSDSEIQTSPTPATFVDLPVADHLPPMKVPTDNPMTPEKVRLGEALFFDTALSQDRTMSCASCHDPQQGWGNGRKFAEGAGGVRGKRNVLSIKNVGFYDKYLFWDGRVKTLEEQALVPVFEKTEMGMESEDQLLERLRENREYREQFAAAFDDGLTAQNVARALAAFERTIYVSETPYDRYVAGDDAAMSESAIAGAKLFFNKRKANCVACHPPPLFTDHLAYNIGIGMDQDEPDWGFHHTEGWAHWGKFRSPSLRGIDQTGPYMHDGSLATLEDVVDYYDKGGIRHQYTDVAVANLGLTRLSDQEKKHLVDFLREGLREISPAEDPKQNPQSN